jgi:hypothetical protein
MIQELAKNPFENNTYAYKMNTIKTIEYFEGKLNSTQRILDIGQLSPLTLSICNHFNIEIDNTYGDLDVNFKIPGDIYDIIIYSHTIEHQFNPLYTLLRIKECMLKKSFLYIFLPCRPHFLRCDGHYNEINDYQMNLLIKRSGMKIVNKKKFRSQKGWRFYIKGIRPILRLFFEFNIVYEIKLNS